MTTDAHTESMTLHVDVNIPEHDERTATPLFHHTRQQLIEREGGRCLICGGTEASTGHPLEAHHHPIERSLAQMIDWQRFQRDCEAGLWGPHAQAFDWATFDPANPYTFVDNMTVNGELLCKAHHIGSDEGKHTLPYPLWIAQRYAVEGYRFNAVETIHHED